VSSNLKEINFNDERDISLTRKGRTQAKKLAKRLIKFRIDEVFISENKRAHQTVLPLLKLKPVPLKKDPRLNEANFGIFRGLTLKEAEGKYPKIYQARLKDKWNYRIPQGESFKDVAGRLNSFLKDLKKIAIKAELKNVLIVTHATILKIFLTKYLKFSLKKSDLIHFENTSLSIFELKNKKIRPIIINDFSHLNKNGSFKSKRIY